MAVSQELLDISVRHQTLIERLKANEVSQFDSFLKELDQSLRERLSRSDELTDYGIQKLNRLLNEVEGIATGIYSRFSLALAANMEEFAVYETGFESRSINAVAAVSGFESLVPASTQIWASVKSTPLSVRDFGGGKLLDPFINDWTKKEVDAITGVIRQGAFEGKTNAEIIRTIRGTKKRKFKDGLLNVSKNHADAVVRTSVQHVANVARSQTWDANRDIIQGYVWVSTLDSGTTITCKSLDGKLFLLGKGPKPPIHIRCRSTTAPDLKPEFDFLGDEATRSSKDGYINQDDNYFDWLKRQPKAFQNQELGKTRATLFREGGLSLAEFSKLQIDKNFKPLTLKEMRKVDPLAFERAGL